MPYYIVDDVGTVTILQDEPVPSQVSMMTPLFGLFGLGLLFAVFSRKKKNGGR